MSRIQRQLYTVAQAALLVTSVSVAALVERGEDWHPAGLVILLLALSLVSDRVEVTVRNQRLSAAFVADTLAMTLLGPGPAVAFGLVTTLVSSYRRRLSPRAAFADLVITPTFMLVGSLLVRALVGDVHDPQHHAATTGVSFALLTFGVFMVSNTLNFVLTAGHNRLTRGRAFFYQVRYLFWPLLPGQVATGALAALLAVAYTNFGYPALAGLVLVLLIFQSLAVALLRSEDRAEQLEARSIRLASLQLGVLATLVETLGLRDRATARHAAAVARYARALACELEMSEADQDLVHTAGLLHDIGKFALPDRILHAHEMSPEDGSVVKRHPQEGATLVGRLDGYGPVADIILYHHERIDGMGYPAGLIGNEIPLLSRVIAVCEVFDTLTARDSYRSPMTPQDAMNEIRRVAGKQLDIEVVEAFIGLLNRDRPLTAVEGDDANFEEELAFERRAHAIAQAVR